LGALIDGQRFGVLFSISISWVLVSSAFNNSSEAFWRFVPENLSGLCLQDNQMQLIFVVRNSIVDVLNIQQGCFFICAVVPRNGLQS
jgi:hypothetical protein